MNIINKEFDKEFVLNEPRTVLPMMCELSFLMHARAGLCDQKFCCEILWYFPDDEKQGLVHTVNL